LYVSGLTKSMFFVGSIVDDGYKLLFDFGQMHIVKDFDLADISCIVTSGSWDNHNGLYLLGSPQRIASICPNPHTSRKLWYCHLGHLNPRNLELLICIGKVQRSPKLEDSKHTCEACQRRKQCQERKSKNEAQRMKKTFDLLNTYLCGPLHVSSSSGTKYIMTFTNDFTRYT
jgi:hypothetical protein